MTLYAEHLVEGRNVLKEADLADVREWLERYNLRTCTTEWLAFAQQVGHDAKNIRENRNLRTQAVGPVK